MKWQATILALLASSAAHAQEAECYRIKSGSVPFKIVRQSHADYRPYDDDKNLTNDSSIIVLRYKKTGDILEQRGEEKKGQKSSKGFLIMNGFSYSGDDEQAKAFRELGLQNAFETSKNFSITYRYDDKKAKWDYKFLRNEAIAVSPCVFDTLVFERVSRISCSGDNSPLFCRKPGSEVMHYSPDLKLVLKRDLDNVGFFFLKSQATKISIDTASDWKMD